MRIALSPSAVVLPVLAPSQGGELWVISATTVLASLTRVRGA